MSEWFMKHKLDNIGFWLIWLTDANAKFPDIEAPGSKWVENAGALKVKYKDYTPTQLFEEVFSDEILTFIVKETVRYAMSKNDASFTFSIEELKVFLGVLLLSGYRRLPSEEMYWSYDEDVTCPLVRKAMSRNRYKKIKSQIHFQDNKQVTKNKHDRGFKIRPMITMIRASFQQFGIFESKLEMMVCYFGRNSLKQFIRGKPIRFGYKFCALCGVSGFCYNFNLYVGLDAEDGDRNDLTILTLGSRVVQTMLHCVQNPASHSIFFDNLFTSRDLLI